MRIRLSRNRAQTRRLNTRSSLSRPASRPSHSYNSNRQKTKQKSTRDNPATTNIKFANQGIEDNRNDNSNHDNGNIRRSSVSDIKGDIKIDMNNMASIGADTKLDRGKYICFSLYGNNPLYTLGAVENARLIPEIYPGWKGRFYVYNNVDKTVQEAILNCGSEVVIINEKYIDAQETIAKCTFWRYYALADSRVEWCIFRDVDSRIGHKEAAAVKQWIKSGYDFHMMYDHHQHTIVMLGGMWGVRGSVLRNIKDLIGQYYRKYDVVYRYNRNYDQYFLKYKIFPEYIGIAKNHQQSYYSYLAHGDPEKCQFHCSVGLQITPFPELPDNLPEFPKTGLSQQTFIGETVLTPYWKPKPVLSKKA